MSGIADGRRLSVRTTLRRMAAAYRARTRFLLGGAAVVFVPLGALDALDGALEGIDPASSSIGAVAAVLAALAVTTVVSTLGNQLYAGLVGEAARTLRSGDRIALAPLLRSLPYWRLAGVDAIYTIAVALGALLLLAPGVVAFAWLALAAPLVTIEDLGVRASFRRSAALVRGSTGRVLAVLGPIVLVAEALSELVEEAANTMLGDGFVSAWVGAAAADALLAPLPALATVILAYELLDLRGPRAAEAARGYVRGAAATE